jgi:formiminotetrahydrofolate cyclodeaminase
MVARLSTGRERYAAHQSLHQEVIAAADRLRDGFLDLAQEDADAYDAFAVAMRMPRADEDQAERRRTALAAAARQAAQVPLATVRRCLEMADLVEALAGRSNVNAASDLVVASLLVDAAARGAAANVRVNLPSVRDASFSEATERELEALLSQVEVATEMTRRVIESGVTREPVTP